jgi:tetratricopeptide (TPR) repeat protein
MRYQAYLSLCAIILSASLAVAQVGTAAISGTVRTVSDSPVGNARVEVHDSRTGQYVNGSYTNDNGTFEITNIPNGSYEVTITQGLHESREQVTLQGLPVALSVRLAIDNTPRGGNSNTISVAELKIPDKARNHLRKAQEAMQKQRTDEAWKEVSRSLEIAPRFAEALTARAVLRMDKGDMHTALDDLQAAITADENFPVAYVVMGAVYNFLDKFTDAERVIERAITLNPASWQAYFELGKAQLGKQEYEASVRNLNKAGDMAPKEYGPIHLVRAHAYLGLKNYPEAMSELEAYLERNPQSPNAAEARKTLDQVRAFAATQH